jgi:hypothetical protein
MHHKIVKNLCCFGSVKLVERAQPGKPWFNRPTEEIQDPPDDNQQAKNSFVV